MGFQFRKHAYKEKFKENTHKCKYILDGKLSRLAGTKFNFHLYS